MPVLDGLVSGWPQDKAPVLDDGQKRTLTSLMDAMPESVRDRLLALVQRWGQTELFGANFAAIIGSLKKQVADSAGADDQRITAAKRLIGLDDQREVIETVLQQVDLLTPPAIGTGFVNALTESRSAETSRPILANWSRFTPSVRRAAIAALLPAQWTRARRRGRGPQSHGFRREHYCS